MFEYDVHFNETTFVAHLLMAPEAVAKGSELGVLLYHAAEWRNDDGWTVARVDRTPPGGIRVYDVRWPAPQRRMPIGAYDPAATPLADIPQTWPR